jgi:hypothetical protein
MLHIVYITIYNIIIIIIIIIILLNILPYNSLLYQLLYIFAIFLSANNITHNISNFIFIIFI